MTTSIATPSNNIAGKTGRIQSIDFLRGVVMVLMAIDHARVFLFNSNGLSPENLSKTTPALFFTRWVTHFCAPVFILLVGVSAFLLGKKMQSKNKLSGFLISRGLILILLELTIFRFCWNRGHGLFSPYIGLLVIWTIGISMLFLAAIIYLPYRVILAFGLAVLLLQNLLLDNISFPEGTAMASFWAFFYKAGEATLFGKLYLEFLYPVLTYFGLVSLGYCLGYVFTSAYSMQQRRKFLVVTGLMCTGAFIILRYFNIYGDPHPWQAGKDTIYSVMAFLRTTKYPVSLLYALMTLGPAILILGLIEPVRNAFTGFFVTIGSVPMFYYLLHLPAFVILGFIVGFNKYDLIVIYLFYAGVVLVLYLLCVWYAKYKFSHREKKWLRYL